MGSLLFSSCTSSDQEADAFGNFEAVELVVSSQGSGQIQHMDIEEGDVLLKNQDVGVIDTITLYLQKVKTQELIKALQAKAPNIVAQINVLKEQLAQAELEQRRVQGLYDGEAATAQQLDQVNSKVKVLQKQIIANTSTLNMQQKALMAEIATQEAGIKLIDYSIAKSRITAPIQGTVLTKYAYSGEITSPGRPLFKMANMDQLICRAYISETQLSQVKIGGEVNVFVDSDKNSQLKYQGKITWVSSKAEFTP